MNKRIPLRTVRVLTIGVAGIVAGVAAGSLVGPAIASTHGDVTPKTSQVAPTFSKNAHGLTFGSALNATSPDNEPDLIQAQATNGQTGYIKKTELDAANGSNVSTPAEALAWDKTSQTPRSIPVYQQDGVTKIGVFIVGDTTGTAAATPTTLSK
jgi:hypothetical protein